jgi:putative YhbY family RNA-binding protein
MRELADAHRIRAFMRAVGARAESECRVYFTGGATAVLEGWRGATIDADILVVPDSDRLLQRIPEIKKELRINVELASPAHFIPELPGWEARSRFIDRIGKASFYHYDFYAQALAKVERGEQKDLGDVHEMLARKLVEKGPLWASFRAIEPLLYRFPAISPAGFRRALEAAVGPDHGAMAALTSKQRQFLKGLAHSLSPMVRVGKGGLTPAVVDEARAALRAHELIKVRIEVEDRGARREAVDRLAADTGAHQVGSVGKVAMLYRAREEEPRLRLPPS